MKDFFTRYRESRKHHYVVPALFGVMFSFALVASYNGADINLRSIQANVLEANNPKPHYDADLLLEQSGGAINIRIGKDAENIESLNFSLLGDPSMFAGLTTENTKTTIIGNEPGIFLVKIGINASVKAGDIITILNPILKGATPIAMIDAGFTSSGTSYTLSVKGE